MVDRTNSSINSSIMGIGNLSLMVFLFSSGSRHKVAMSRLSYLLTPLVMQMDWNRSGSLPYLTIEFFNDILVLQRVSIGSYVDR